VPNCIAKPKGEKRSYICDEIHTIKDVSSLNLRRPIDRGYVVNWDLQKDIWHHVFSKLLKVDPKKCHLVLTEAPFNLPQIATTQDEDGVRRVLIAAAMTYVAAAAASVMWLLYYLSRMRN
jgi:actin-related protein 6